MMPHYQLSAHLNLYLPTQNPAAFTTILSTPHKHMAQHNTIPYTATEIHLPTPKHTGNCSHSSYTILLLRPLQLYPIDSSDVDNMMELCSSSTYQRTHSHAGYFGVLVHVFNTNLFKSNIIFLNSKIHFKTRVNDDKYYRTGRETPYVLEEQGLTYLSEALSGKFILSQPCTGWNIKTYIPTNFPSP